MESCTLTLNHSASSKERNMSCMKICSVTNHSFLNFPGPSLNIKYLSPIFHKTFRFRVDKCNLAWYLIFCANEKLFATLLGFVPMETLKMAVENRVPIFWYICLCSIKIVNDYVWASLDNKILYNKFSLSILGNKCMY